MAVQQQRKSLSNIELSQVDMKHKEEPSEIPMRQESEKSRIEKKRSVKLDIADLTDMSTMDDEDDSNSAHGDDLSEISSTAVKKIKVWEFLESTKFAVIVYTSAFIFHVIHGKLWECWQDYGGGGWFI